MWKNMFLTEDINIKEYSFTNRDITELYKTLNECNEEYCRIAIKMCKYEHQAILNEDSVLLEEAKEGFGAKVKELIEKLWVNLRTAFTRFKNWFRQVIIKIGVKRVAGLIKKIKPLFKENIIISSDSVNSDMFDAFINSNIDQVLDIDQVEKIQKKLAENKKNKTGNFKFGASHLDQLQSFFLELPTAFNAVTASETKAKEAYIRSKNDNDKTELTNAVKKSAAAFRYAKNAIKLAITLLKEAIKKVKKNIVEEKVNISDEVKEEIQKDASTIEASFKDITDNEKTEPFDYDAYKNDNFEKKNNLLNAPNPEIQKSADKLNSQKVMDKNKADVEETELKENMINKSFKYYFENYIIKIKDKTIRKYIENTVNSNLRRIAENPDKPSNIFTGSTLTTFNSHIFDILADNKRMDAITIYNLGLRLEHDYPSIKFTNPSFDDNNMGELLRAENKRSFIYLLNANGFDRKKKVFRYMLNNSKKLPK